MVATGPEAEIERLLNEAKSHHDAARYIDAGNSFVKVSNVYEEMGDHMHTATALEIAGEYFATSAHKEHQRLARIQFGKSAMHAGKAAALTDVTQPRKAIEKFEHALHVLGRTADPYHHKTTGRWRGKELTHAHK